MIIEKLQKQKDFTAVEKNIAEYLLMNGYEAKDMSISTLALATFSSPAAITRLCRKLDVSGYKDFRILFSAEYDAFSKKQFVDANRPFSKEDSFEEITRNLERLNYDTISRVIAGFDYNQLRRIVYRMRDADVINIVGIGTSVNVAKDFQLKMLHFGKQVNLTENAAFLPGYCMVATDKTVNIAISQSGETKEVLECLQMLKERKRYRVLITANPESSASRFCQEVVSVHIEEDKSYAEKIDSFAIYNALHFVLDCLFAFLYRLNYDNNVQRLRENASQIERQQSPDA